MLQTDILYVLQWWLVLFGSGFVVLPLVALIFPTFLDRGYAFAKIFGVVLISYLVFLLGTIKVAPFTLLTIYAVSICVASISLLSCTQTSAIKHLEMKKRWKIFVLEEAVFLLGLLFWAYIRSFNPDIYGLEKYMDFGFVNSILRSTYFPPRDMWFTPFPINYYYFGHLVTAVLTKASLLPSFVTFNLMMATLFSLCFTQVFSFTATLWRHAFPKSTHSDAEEKQFPGLKSIISTGGLAAFLVTFSGNLHVLYAFFSQYSNDKPQPLWELKFLPNLFPNGYWYPNATRFIYNTIHEFPIYSWVVSDLHGHVLDIPVVLFTIALIYSFFIRHYHHSLAGMARWYYLLGIGAVLAVMYMTNAWDGLIYLLLTGLIFLSLEWQRVGQRHSEHNSHNPLTLLLPERFPGKHAINRFLLNHWYWDLAVGLGSYMLIVGISFAAFSFPFSHFFNPEAIVKGIGVLCSPKLLTDRTKFGPFLFEVDHCQKSPWWQLLTLYGFFYVFIIAFVVFLQRKKTTNSSDTFVALLVILATMLIIIPEFLYMKDIYPAHYRANTMFKLVFQSFMMLSIASAYIIMRTIVTLRQQAKDIGRIFIFTGYTLFVTFLLSLVFTYPVLAIRSFYGEVITRKDTTGNAVNPKGLNGITYLQNRYPSDFAAIAWLNKEVSGQLVILEAQGDSYTDYARVSANTGLPTVLGWTVHEWLWRGSYDVPAPRIGEIQTLYETTSPAVAEPLLRKYHIVYVFIGDLERQKYTNISEAKFDQLGKIVFQLGTTKVYRLTTNY